MAATRQVLGTAELLEAILLHLPIRDAILVQQLCKNWFDAITSSIELQRALFLRPTKSLGKDQVHNMTLSTSCTSLLGEPDTRTLITSVLPIEKYTATSYKLKTGGSLPEVSGAASWQKMLMCQPPREMEQFFINCTSTSHYKNSTKFVIESTTLLTSTGAKIYYGKQFGLDAIRVKQAGGVTLGTFVEALEIAKKEGFDEAKMKGAEFKLGWVRSGCSEAVIDFWTDIKTVQKEKLEALPVEEDEEDEEDDDDDQLWEDEEEDEGGEYEDEDERMLEV